MCSTVTFSYFNNDFAVSTYRNDPNLFHTSRCVMQVSKIYSNLMIHWQKKSLTSLKNNIFLIPPFCDCHKKI